MELTGLITCMVYKVRVHLDCQACSGGCKTEFVKANSKERSSHVSHELDICRKYAGVGPMRNTLVGR